MEAELSAKADLFDQSQCRLAKLGQPSEGNHGDSKRVSGYKGRIGLDFRAQGIFLVQLCKKPLPGLRNQKFHQ